MSEIAFNTRLTSRANIFDHTEPYTPRKTVRSPRKRGGHTKFVKNEISRIASRILLPVNPAVTYAVVTIRELAEYVQINDLAKARLLESLRAAMANNSIYPTVTTDGDDGLAAQWRAGKRYLALEMSSDGLYSFVETDDAGVVIRNDVGCGKPNLDHLRGAIRHFTAQVESANPDWRRHYGG